MASQKLDLQIRGLYTSQNNLSGVPPGALAVAQNLVIDSKSIASSRRGQSQFGAALTVGSGQVTKLFNYAQGMIARYDNKLAYRLPGLMTEHTASAWSDYSGTYLDPESGYKVRSLEALRNFYFTTLLGVYKLDALTSTPRTAGVVQALGGTAALTGVTGFLVDNSAIRYRLIWGYRDVNNNLVRGAPSQPLIVRNSSGNDADVNSTWVIPDSITTEYFYQLYRSKNTATAADEPSEELQLVAEGNPLSAEITAGVFTINDVTPESLMGETLYTSPSQQGIENANDVPPKCNDMDVYKGCAFYVNTTGFQQLTTTIISVDSPSLGYVVDATVDTVDGDATLTSITSTANLRVGMRVVGTGIPVGTTILSITNGTTLEMSANATATGTVSIEFQDRFSIYTDDFWAGSAENAATNTFLAETGGTPATNIEDTALSLVQIINRTGTIAYAFYLSGTEDLPGQILLRERDYSNLIFDISTTAGASFSPEVPQNVYIESNTIANPTVITTKTEHNLTTGDFVSFFNSPLDSGSGERIEVTVISPTTFSIEFDAAEDYGAAGYIIEDDLPVVSTADRNQNYTYVSKPSEVESVPSYRFFPIGSANFPIERVVALRDGIFFFKEDGIFRISGESFENFTVALLDNTVKLRARESAVPFNNQIFCFTDQGVCAVSDSGVQIMSVPIENLFNVISSDDYPNFSTATFGVAYESARQYMLFTVSDPADTFATEGWVYNSLTDAWTGPWPMNRTCGVVATVEDKLIMAEADTGQCLMERKSFTLEDFADKQFAVTISAINTATTMTLASVSNVTEGMTIVQGSRRQYIEEINGSVLTVSSTNGFSAAAATVYQPIENEIEFVPIDAENPGLLKQFSEVSVFFRNAAFREIDAIFSSNISSGQTTVPLQSVASSGWGQFGWGQAPWGSPIGGQNVLRTYIPRNAQRAHWLNMRLRTNEAFTGFSLQGMSIIYNTMSPRFK